ncbi:MAG: nucleotide exchange factor GrpE [Eubacterium sp.]|nr:nucleotide exchange factor GrpE [Eubacterium sp.]
MSKKEKENLEVEEAVQDEAVKDAETEKAAEENTADKELADTKDQLLRTTAEYANFRKRSEKEKQDAYVFAKSETIKELLPVIDNLERALASESEDYESLKKGVELTFNNLVATLGKLGVEIFGAPGEEFDPNLHNAVMHIEDENYKNGEIVDVFQKGYKINDKIIRPAMVKSAN